MSAEIRVTAPFTANTKQIELARAWKGPSKEILAGGAVRSGKTQAAARLLVEDALTNPCIYVVARQTYKELKDSTQHAMLYGDGSLPPLIPLDARDHTYGTQGFHGSDNAVRLRNGAEIRFRNLEHAHVWLNVAYGGIMIDQAEEMDEGSAGELLYDTILTRLSDPRGRRKVLLVANPASEMHWLYRRFVGPKRLPPTSYVQFSLRDNEENLPPDLIESLEALRDSRPFFYRCYVLGEWGAFEGAAYPEFTDCHVACPEEMPNEWRRAEGMDHGASNPTAWLAAVVDYDSNLIIRDEHYAIDFIDEHAKEIKRRRAEAWSARNDDGSLIFHPCYADPSINSRTGARDPRGNERTVENEYREHGIGFVRGQNDRKAGHARIRELLHPNPDRAFPEWHPRFGERGSPRLFVAGHCENMIQQLRNARVKPEGADALDVVDPDWESTWGHAHASLRYLALGLRRPSERPPDPEDDDPRVREARRMEDMSYRSEGETILV